MRGDCKISNNTGVHGVRRAERLRGRLEILLSVAIAVLFVLTVGSVSVRGAGWSVASPIPAGTNHAWRPDGGPGSVSTGLAEGGPGIICGCVCAHNCGGGPNHVWLTITIYNDGGQVALNGSTYVNGQVAALQADVPVSVSAQGVYGAYSFGYWESDVGSFGSPKSSSTTFTPVSGNAMGTLALIIDYVGISNGPWAGYITNNAVSGISCVSGEFYNVPATTYVGSGKPMNDVNSIWVGIGGVGNSPLWQGGINVFNIGAFGGGSSANYWVPFAQGWESSSSEVYSSSGSQSTNFMQGLYIAVCTSNTVNTVRVEAYYGSTFPTIWWNASCSESSSGNCSGFSPNTYTAEWILEAPTNTGTGSLYPLGDFAQFGLINPSWTLNGVQTTEFLGPLAYVTLEDTTHTTQYVTPGTITGGFEQFPLTYST